MTAIQKLHKGEATKGWRERERDEGMDGWMDGWM